MKRGWNWAVWTGASLVFLGVVSYPLFFVRFPGLRDFPWANLPMIALGLVLLALGLVRAFGIRICVAAKSSAASSRCWRWHSADFSSMAFSLARGMCYPLRTTRREWARRRQISRCRIRRITQ